MARKKRQPRIKLAKGLVIIYAIRDRKTGDLGYVGKTKHIHHRVHDCYGSRVVGWSIGRRLEHVELERVPEEESAFWERWWIDYLHAIGCDLQNARWVRRAPYYGRRATHEWDGYGNCTIASRVSRDGPWVCLR